MRSAKRPNPAKGYGSDPILVGPWPDDPVRPPEYRGQALEWHLTRGQPTDDELRMLLRRIRELSPRDQMYGLLLGLKSRPRPALAATLLEIEPVVPDAVRLAYNFTLGATATAMAKAADAQKAARPAEVVELVLAAVRTYRRVAQASRDAVPDFVWGGLVSQWRGVWKPLAKDIETAPPFAEEVAHLQDALAQALLTLATKGRAYAGGTDALRAAAEIGDARACDRVLDALDDWDACLPKILGPAAAANDRYNVEPLAVACIVIDRRGGPEQRRRQAVWAERRHATASGKEREFLRGVLDGLVRDERRIPIDVRRSLYQRVFHGDSTDWPPWLAERPVPR